MSKQHPKNKQDEMISRFKNGESATKIAKSMDLYATSVVRVLKRNGFKMKTGKGDQHSGWKGGRGLKGGYWTVYNPTHPRSLNIGRVFEHILIMEKHIGRFIKKGEPIHHIDLDKKNNDIKNLYLFKNHQEHQKAHSSLESVASQLYKYGVIGFSNGYYFLRKMP